MISNIRSYTYETTKLDETLTFKKSIWESITKETTPNDLNQLCRHFNRNIIAQLPENPTRIAYLQLDMFDFVRLATTSIKLQNNHLLYYIVNKIITLLDNTNRRIIFNETLDYAFESADENNQLNAYNTIRKLIQKINLKNEFDIYNRAVKTGNVALFCLLIKRGSHIPPKTKRVEMEASSSQFEQLKFVSTAFQHLKFQLSVKNDFIEKAILSIDREKDVQRFSVSNAKLIVDYCEGHSLNDALDSGIFIQYVIETVISSFPIELTPLILQYSGNYDE